jgi:hypothetical protein
MELKTRSIILQDNEGEQTIMWALGSISEVHVTMGNYMTLRDLRMLRKPLRDLERIFHRPHQRRKIKGKRNQLAIRLRLGANNSSEECRKAFPRLIPCRPKVKDVEVSVRRISHDEKLIACARIPTDGW